MPSWPQDEWNRRPLPRQPRFNGPKEWDTPKFMALAEVTEPLAPPDLTGSLAAADIGAIRSVRVRPYPDMEGMFRLFKALARVEAFTQVAEVWMMVRSWSPEYQAALRLERWEEAEDRKRERRFQSFVQRDEDRIADFNRVFERLERLRRGPSGDEEYQRRKARGERKRFLLAFWERLHDWGPLTEAS